MERKDIDLIWFLVFNPCSCAAYMLVAACVFKLLAWRNNRRAGRAGRADRAAREDHGAKGG